MKTVINKEEMKREWVINHWYEKVMYVVGVIYFVCLALGFTIGFIEGLLG